MTKTQVKVKNIFYLIGITISLLGLVQGRIITIENNCKNTIWIGAFDDKKDVEDPFGGGKPLQSGYATFTEVRDDFNGRIWGRTDCDFSKPPPYCLTGDSGDAIKKTGKPPASLAEFNFNETTQTDWYDVSLVDGFNIPVSIALKYDKSQNPNDCKDIECKADLNPGCPADLQLKGLVGGTEAIVGCYSNCEKYHQPQDCCSGEEHNTPETCPPPPSTKYFKTLCPQAYSYAYDDTTSLHTCPRNLKAEYHISFC